MGTIARTRSWRPADALKSLGSLRDGILVVSALLYLLGYLELGFYAASRDLGALPAIDAQYLVAGLAPALMLALTAGLFFLLVRVWRWSMRPVTARRRRWGVNFTRTWVFLVVGLFIVGRWWAPARTASLMGAVIAAYVDVMIRGSSHWTDRLMARAVIGYIALMTAVLPILAIRAYTQQVLPHIPEALGGPPSRCVQLDLDAPKLSAETQRRLFDGDPAPAGAATRRTRPVTLVFDGSSFTIISDPASGTSPSWLRISSSTIAAVQPCAAPMAMRER